jgi:hypothetical protein
MPALPPDLQTFYDHVDAADQRAERLTAGLTDEQFLWRPDEGRRWSVALCLDHLAVSNTVYGEAVHAGIEQARARGWTRRGPAVPGFFGRQFANSLEPPAKFRSSAPGKIKPMPSRGRDEIMRAYRGAHDRVRQLIREAAEFDTNRATFPNPFFSFINVSVSTGFLVICAHDRRHLWQAERVTQEAGFPRAG